MSEFKEISFDHLGVKGKVRVTPDGSLSVLDIISLFCPNENAEEIWDDIKNGKNSEMAATIKESLIKMQK